MSFCSVKLTYCFWSETARSVVSVGTVVRSSLKEATTGKHEPLDLLTESYTAASYDAHEHSN